LAIALFLYLNWRNLKDDYPEEKLISFGWLAVLGFLFFGRVGFGLLNWGVWGNWSDWISVWQKPGMDYLMATIGFVVIACWWGRVNQWKFFAFMEDNLKNFLIFVFVLMIDELMRSRFAIEIVAYMVVLMLVYVMSLWLFKKYRSFVWYRSGKKGFVFLSTGFLANLLIAGVLFWFRDKIVLMVLSLAMGLISLFGLFILGDIFQPLLINRRKKNGTE
jgi:hypothetical protein